ncbi:Upstream activation factor subunit spp27 [Gracilariopsis chorda]|uniref:Upstream activation factor subunit spp27 n=1 Tax=Gracilariopsis chorda TaxID=448386 RepID=A0A2V3J5S6_9FLOR|nr:Upstream activation factor subunit spp27 [Gracilariopsis chorda]|eukprot:PXF48740.1 Upstream activation factor subunit spp27 [Gracilariopsis chorda]
MVLPSEETLTTAINDILRSNDLERITLRMVMSMLSEKLSLPLSQLQRQKPLVRRKIDDFLAAFQGEGADHSTDQPSTAAGSKRKSSVSEPKPVKSVKLTGLERAVVLSEPLAEFIGETVISRSHIPKHISAYAKKHDLQDPTDRRRIICDDALKAALSVDHFTFFSLAKTVSGLVRKPEECDEHLQELAKKCEEKIIQEKLERKQREALNPPPPRPTKRPKQDKSNPDRPRRPSAFSKPMQLSDALTAVCGESQLSRTDVVKKIWEYIRENQLKDPDDGKKILCDEKLMAIFKGSKTVSNMGIAKFLSAHMTKIP